VDDYKLVEAVEPLVDLFEVRIDLIGQGWQSVATRLKKPWIACNRRIAEGGKWQGAEAKRIAELFAALEIGARIVDIELGTPDIEETIKVFRGRAETLVSYHDLKETPTIDRMRQIVINQLAVGADICKVVTTARTFKDNLAVLQLITLFPASRVISFCMGAVGQVSRVLCPLAGGDFTYASLEQGKESAEGQITVKALQEIYRTLKEK